MKVAFVVIVIGENYINNFNSKFKKNMELYCKKYNYDLFILNQTISEIDIKDKKLFYWQRFLVPNKYKEYDYVVSIDSDIYINYESPPLPFEDIPIGKIAAVNERKYLENYEWRETIQIKNGWEKTGKEWYALSGESKNYNDHINGGLVIYQPLYHSQLMVKLYNENIGNYRKYHQDDQSFLSSYLIDNNMIYWLDQRYNRIWSFWRDIFYPNFYNLDNSTRKIFVENFKKLNYFTHFTGSIDIEYI